MLLKLIYNRYKKEFLKLAFHDQDFKNKPDNELSFQFLDSEGNRYFSYGDATKLPFRRKEMLEVFYKELDESLTPDTAWQLIEAIDKLIEDEINNPSKRGANSAKIRFVVDEFRARRRHLLRPDILWRIFAVMYIREDEVPELWDEDFQKAKIEQLKKDAAQGAGLYDFFYKKPLVSHLPYSDISEEQLEIFLHQSAKEINNLEKLKAMLSTEGLS